MTYFNHSETYHREIEPLMDKVFKLCSKHKIPLVAHIEVTFTDFPNSGTAASDVRTYIALPKTSMNAAMRACAAMMTHPASAAVIAANISLQSHHTTCTDDDAPKQ